MLQNQPYSPRATHWRGILVRALFVCALLFTLLRASALAEPAADISQLCRYGIGEEAKYGAKKFSKLNDHSYTTYYELGKGRMLTIDGHGQEIGGLFVQFYDNSGEIEVQAQVDGTWQTTEAGGTHLTDWFPLPAGATAARIVNQAGQRLFFAQVTVFGPGEQPPQAARWRDLDKADLMLVACHPDDELLWFGGLLPTYAGERGLRVSVIYAVPSTPRRRLELLDGLWHCGVQDYPDFLKMPDLRANTLAGQYKQWKKDSLCLRLTEKLRRYKPDVVVTHDFGGEYGHGGHRAVADAVRLCIPLAAEHGQYPASEKEWGLWQVLKCYVHLYDQGELVFDWHVPLTAFGGKDGMTVATEALACHVSQTAHGWAMEEGGPCDNTRFGLLYTQVGPDSGAVPDLFEHLPQALGSRGDGPSAQVEAEEEELLVEELLLEEE